MNWPTNKYEIAAGLCRTGREEYWKYCVRTQAATYAGSALADFETAISRQFGPAGVWDPHLAIRISFRAHIYLSIAEQHLFGLQKLLSGEISSDLPLVSDLPCRAARSGLKMGVGCPLTSFLLDRVEVVH